MSETDDCKRPWDHGADFYSTSDQDERLTLDAALARNGRAP